MILRQQYYNVSSEQFKIQRGCRQGDPIAAIYFSHVLRFQLQCILNKHNHDIRGIIIDGNEHNIYHYAYDTCLILSGSPYFHILDGLPKSLFTASDTIYFFLNLSGLQINIFKTKIFQNSFKEISSDVFHHSRWKLDWGSNSSDLLGI